jgi:hypothetical protein
MSPDRKNNSVVNNDTSRDAMMYHEFGRRARRFALHGRHTPGDKWWEKKSTNSSQLVATYLPHTGLGVAGQG